MKRSALVYGVTLLAMLMSSALVPVFSESASIAHGGTLRLALPNTIDNFSQFLTTSYQAWYFNQMVYPDLGIPLPGQILHVAASSYWSSSDAKTWYFRIRPNLTWSDGVPVNATDLAYSLRLMFSTYKWGAGSLSLYSSYLASNVNNSIKVDNSSIAEVDLKQPFGTLGDIIGTENTPNLVPEHIFVANNYVNNQSAPGPNFGTLVGAGAFYVDNYHQGDTVVILKPNPHGSPFGGDSKGVPYLNEIDVQLVPATSNLALMLKAGQIDAAPILPSDASGLTSSNPSIRVVYGPSPDTWNLEFPIWTFPYNMTGFRQALAYAINRSDLVQTALSGYGIAGNEGYLPPSSDPSFNSSVPSYTFNTTKAASLLAGMGWVKQGSFYNLPNNTAFSPTIYVPSENTELVTAGSRIVQDLHAAGINAQLQSIATTSMVNIWAKGLNMYVHEQDYGYPSSELLFDYSFDGFGTGPPLTGPLFESTSVEANYNATLQQLNTAGNASGRAQLEQKLQGIIADNLPSITLFYVDSLWAVNTQNFGGWPTSPSTMEWPGGEFNQTALASIYSLSAQSGASSSSGSSSSTSATPGTTSSMSTSSTAGGTSPPNYTLIAGVVIVVIVIAGVAAYALRRR